MPVPAPHRGSLPRRVWTIYRYPLLVFTLSRIVTAGVMAMEGWVTRAHMRASPSFDNLFGAVGMWDSIWYRQIALQGYDPALFHANTPAFLPLWPACLWIAHQLIWWIDLTWVGAGLSTMLFAVGLCLLYRLADDLLGRAIARRSVLYLAISPLAFVFSAVYAESLFLALAVGSFLLVERKHVVWSSVLGALAVLARPVGIMLAPALAWRVWRDGRELTTGRRVLRLWPVLLLPAAELAWTGYLWWRFGDMLAATDAEKRGWGRGASFPPTLLINTFLDEVWHRHLLRFAVHLSFAALWLGLLVALVRQRKQIPAEYAIFAFGVVLLPFFAGTVLSAGRLGMMGFPLFWALAILGRREGVDTAVKILFPPLMAALMFVAYAYQTFTP
ncbi:MAG: mannosyltransferase family protein [Gaiellales bacterium]